MQLYHNHPNAGHFRQMKTWLRFRAHYIWPQMRKNIATFIRCYTICAQTKGALTLSSPHLLPIPIGLWQDVMVDLVTSQPLIKGTDAICTIVDHFTKEIIIFTVTQSILSEELACEYHDRVWRI